MFSLREDPRELAAHWCDAMPPGMSVIESVSHLVTGLMGPPRLTISRDFVEMFPDCPGLRLPRRALGPQTRDLLDAIERDAWRSEREGSLGSFRGLRMLPGNDYVFHEFAGDDALGEAFDVTTWIEALMRTMCDGAGEYRYAVTEVCRAAMLRALSDAPPLEPPPDVDALVEAFDSAIDEEMREPAPRCATPSPPPRRLERKPSPSFMRALPRQQSPPSAPRPRYEKSDRLEGEIAAARRAERARQRARDVRLFVAGLVDRVLSW